MAKQFSAQKSLAIKAAVLACSMTFLGLTACGQKDDTKTVGQKLDTVVANTSQSATDVKAQAEASMAKVGDAVKDATQKAEASGSKTADAIATGADDIAITASIGAGFAKDSELSAIKIDVDTKNGNVVLIGPAPNAAARDRATTIAKSVKGVGTVSNKLVVKAS